jgi:hypothetical protein
VKEKRNREIIIRKEKDLLKVIDQKKNAEKLKNEMVRIDSVINNLILGVEKVSNH